jgi:glycosyltransferase involved in cell wall biosynthesis
VAIEIVVVDDGSDDGSAAAAVGAGGGALTLIHQPPSGVSRARNAGTAAAGGEFVQYLDADDVLVPGTLRRRVDALAETGADVAYADWVYWQRRDDGRFGEGERVCRRLGPRPDVDLIADAWWPPGALLFRRSIVDRVLPWREDLPIVQDARFQLDAALSGAAFVHVPSVGLWYRRDGIDSLSRRDPVAFLDDCYRNLNDLHDRWNASGALDPARRQALARGYSHVVRGYFQTDRTRFDEALRRIRSFDRDFLPSGPASLRWLSRAIGYEAAEHVAAGWRRVSRRTAGASG